LGIGQATPPVERDQSGLQSTTPESPFVRTGRSLHVRRVRVSRPCSVYESR